jgi:hypothetical protein
MAIKKKQCQHIVDVLSHDLKCLEYCTVANGNICLTVWYDRKLVITASTAFTIVNHVPYTPPQVNQAIFNALQVLDDAAMKILARNAGICSGSYHCSKSHYNSCIQAVVRPKSFSNSVNVSCHLSLLL